MRNGLKNEHVTVKRRMPINLMHRDQLFITFRSSFVPRLHFFHVLAISLGAQVP